MTATTGASQVPGIASVSDRALAAVAIGLLPVGIFVVPYLFPPPQRMLSASSLVGYNNSLAYLWYAAFVGLSAVAIARLMRVRPSFSRPVASEPLFSVPPPLVLLLMAGHLVVFAAMYLRQHGFFLAEALYFEDTAYRALAGAVPFVDFTFFYGPLLLYPTVFLSHVVGLLAGYAVSYVLQYIAGLYLLYVVISALVENRRAAVAWFAVFALGLFNPILGLNYTLLRFMLPAVGLLTAWRCAQGLSVARWAASAACATLALLCSPDIGIVTIAAIGCLGLFALFESFSSGEMQGPLSVFAVPAAGVAVAGVLLLLIDGTVRPVLAYLRPVVTFAAGGWNTQIDPSLPVLTLIGCTVLVATWFWSAWRAPDLRARRPLIAAYAVMFFLMQRASFGKADIDHIAYSGLPVYLAAVAWSSQSGKGVSRQWLVAAAFIVGVVLPLQFYHAMLFVPSLLQRASAPSALSASSATGPSPTKQAIQASIGRAVQHFGPDRLYYMHQLEYYRLPVYLEYRLKPFMYYPTLAAAFTADDIERVIQELRTRPAIVLARRADLSADPPRPYDTHWPYFLTSSPLPGSTVFNLTLEFQSRLERPLVDFLTTAYTRQFEDGDIVGLALRDAPAASSHALQ